MLDEKLLEVLKNDGVVAIVTNGADGPHVVNTWNSYIRFTDDGKMLIPAGYMHKTETNLAGDDKVLLTMGSSRVAGKNGPGTGFLVRGKAAMLATGPEFMRVKGRFTWARAALVVTIDSAEQTL